MSFVIYGERSLNYDPEEKVLTISLPVQFTKRKGRTEIITPDGRPVMVKKGQHPCPPLRDALVRSHQWHH